MVVQLVIAAAPDTMGDSQLIQSWARSVDEKGIVYTYLGSRGRSEVGLDYLPVIPYMIGAMARLNRVAGFERLDGWRDPLNLLSKLPILLSSLAISLLPSIRDFERRRLIGAGALGVVVMVAIFLPFILSDNLTRVLDPAIYSQVYVISVNAHNLWWLATTGPPLILATRELIGPITYEAAAITVFLALYAATLVEVWRTPDSDRIFFCMAFVAFAFFMSGPFMRENYMFSIFPFLAIACREDRGLRWLFAALSLTYLANMVLHDPYIMIEHFYGIPFKQEYESTGMFYNSRAFMSPTHRTLTLINASFNAMAFGYALHRLITPIIRPRNTPPAAV